MFVLAGTQDSKIVVRVGFSGFDSQCFFKLLHGAVQIANLTERGSKVYASSNTVRLRCNSFAKLSSSGGISLRLERYFAATQIHPLSCNQILQTIEQRIRYSHSNGSLLSEMRSNLIGVSQTTKSHRQ